MLPVQGENNAFQCHGANSSAQNGKDSGGPIACGSIADNTGYACMMKNLIETWREAWSVEPGTTDKSFPFGLVSLAGGTSEGHAANMGAFRYAQTGNTGLLPNEHMPNTFAAQAFGHHRVFFRVIGHIDPLGPLRQTVERRAGQIEVSLVDQGAHLREEECHQK